MGSNPVQAWIFFRLSFRNCLSCVVTARIFLLFDIWHVRYRRLNLPVFAKCARSRDFLRSLLRIARKANPSSWAILSNEFSKLPHRRDRRKKSPSVSASIGGENRLRFSLAIKFAAIGVQNRQVCHWLYFKKVMNAQSERGLWTVCLCVFFLSDINECMDEDLYNCTDEFHKCVNTRGSYKCECDRNLYFIDGKCRGNI